jgi:hypothetical protein
VLLALLVLLLGDASLPAAELHAVAVARTELEPVRGPQVPASSTSILTARLRRPSLSGRSERAHPALAAPPTPLRHPMPAGEAWRPLLVSGDVHRASPGTGRAPPLAGIS